MSERVDWHRIGWGCVCWYIVLAGIAARSILCFMPATLHGDTATYALMAKYIAEFREFPIYMWQSHYGGMFSSYLAALFFALFGVSAFWFNMVGFILSCFWVFFSVLLARRLMGGIGAAWVLLFVGLPSFTLLDCSTLVGTPHTETFFFGGVFLILVEKWYRTVPTQRIFYFFFGLCAGLGVWATPGIVPLVLLFFILLVSREKKWFSKPAMIFVGGFLLGYMPALIYNMQYPGATFIRLAGRILVLDRATVASAGLILSVTQRILWRISFLPYLFAKIPQAFASLAGIIPALLFFSGIAWTWKKEGLLFFKDITKSFWRILLLYVFFAGFFIICVGEMAARFMIPLYLAAPFFIGRFLGDVMKKPKILQLALCVVLLLGGYPQLFDSFRHRSIRHHQELAAWLAERNLRWGFCDYWNAYPIVFL
ncbi:MAG: hypothetical protein KKC84_04890, partial [Candidatus Omnitrophica bacterium]|nr:hypothetical protein [Candidatus Omnitrophota bacterium]